MKLLSWRRDEIIIESAGFCRFQQRITCSKRMPRGSASYPFIIVRDRQEFKRPFVLNHERIHLRQQREMLVLGFWIFGWVESFIGRFVLGLEGAEKYYWRACEQEAYLNHHNLDYLKTRPVFAMWRYIQHKRRFRVTDVPGEIEFY